MPAPMNELVQLVIIYFEDLRPVNLVTREGFKELMTYLEPGYRLSSATHFTHLIECKYDAVKEKVRLVLQQQAKYIAITADLWTSITYHGNLSDGYLSLSEYQLLPLLQNEFFLVQD